MAEMLSRKCRFCESGCTTTSGEVMDRFKRHHAHRYPLAVLESFLTTRGVAVNDVLGGANRTRWRREGVPLFTVDELAIRQGYNPSLIYGEDWWA